MLLLHSADRGVLSAVVVAVSALLVTLTRPQNALSYGAIYLVAIFFAVPKNKGRLIQISRAICFVGIVFAIAAVCSPMGTIVKQIKEYVAVFGTSHPIQFSFVDQQLDFVRSGWLWFVSGFLYVSVVFLRWGDRYPSKIVVVVFVATVSVVLVAAVFGKSSVPLSFSIGPRTGVVAFCALSFACLRKEVDVRLIVLLGLAALIPWAATIGGATPVRAQLSYFSGISIFIAISGISIVARKNVAVITAASCIGLWVTFSAIETGMAAPYRLAAPIDMQLISTSIGRQSELKVDSKTSEFINSLQRDTKQGGFCQEDPAIDLSGSLPGAVFVIGGRMPVFPWIFSGYPFSNHLAREYLKRVGQSQLTRSWLITSETPNSFTTQELQSMGVDFAAYRLVSVLRHPVDGTSVKLYAPLINKGPC